MLLDRVTRSHVAKGDADIHWTSGMLSISNKGTEGLGFREPGR
jgi:hypothetical protein